MPEWSADKNISTGLGPIEVAEGCRSLCLRVRMSPVGAIQDALGDCCGQSVESEFGVDCAIDVGREEKVHNETVLGQTLRLIHQL